MNKEKKLIDVIGKKIRQSPVKKNKIHEADCELIQLDNKLVSITSDTIYEEIHEGIFKDMYSIGWYSAMMSISDVYATGASVTGILLNLNLPEDMDSSEIESLISGAEECCKYHETFILGGDTNFGSKLSISTFAIGTPLATKQIKRSGLKVGDYIYATEDIGVGNLTALINKSGKNLSKETAKSLLPKIDKTIPLIIGKYANAAIDTSDGLIHAIFDLLQQNIELGIQLNSTDLPYHKLVKKTATDYQLPYEVFAGGEVGDYGLVFSIPSNKQDEFKTEVNTKKLKVHAIGRVCNKKGLYLNEKLVPNYSETLMQKRGNTKEYIQHLIQALT